MKNINWPLVLMLSLSGFLFAGLTIASWIAGYEHLVGLIIIAGVAKGAVFFAQAAPKRNAFAAGFLTGVFAVWTQAAFLPLYFKNNPEYLEIEIPFGLTPGAWTVLFSPLAGLAAGVLALLIAAIIAWPMAKFKDLFRSRAQ